MSWLTLDNKIIATKEDFPEGCFGFVYKIMNETNGKFYIGKKQVFSRRKKKFGKKKIAAMTDKRAKKYEYVETESNWKDYISSNKELVSDIENGDSYNKYILEFAHSKYHLTYLEAKYQFNYGVLETEDCYNDNILGRFFRSIFDFKG